MRVLIASDKFKHSLSSDDVARHLSNGLLSERPDLVVDSMLIADGGEGTVEAALRAGFTSHEVTVSGPTGLPVKAELAVRDHEAVIEIAGASGLASLPGGAPDALGATSLGAGQLIRAALDLSCTRIIIGAGGSACTDGGAGLLVGLGARLLDADGQTIGPGGGPLAHVAAIDLEALDPRLRKARFQLASDVDNPLLGNNGAAAIFGPQKGASSSDVRVLERGLTRFVKALEREIGPRATATARQPGAGAAGGIGYAAMAVLAARCERGVDLIGLIVGLDDRIEGAALVITGEGSLDRQSLAGKAPLGVSQAAARSGVPVVAVCGRTTLSAETLSGVGFARTFALTDIEPDIDRCIIDAGSLLEDIGRTIASEMLPAPEDAHKWPEEGTRRDWQESPATGSPALLYGIKGMNA